MICRYRLLHQLILIQTVDCNLIVRNSRHCRIIGKLHDFTAAVPRKKFIFIIHCHCYNAVCRIAQRRKAAINHLLHCPAADDMAVQSLISRYIDGFVRTQKSICSIPCARPRHLLIILVNKGVKHFILNQTFLCQIVQKNLLIRKAHQNTVPAIKQIQWFSKRQEFLCCPCFGIYLINSSLP